MKRFVLVVFLSVAVELDIQPVSSFPQFEPDPTPPWFSTDQTPQNEPDEAPPWYQSDPTPPWYGTQQTPQYETEDTPQNEPEEPPPYQTEQASSYVPIQQVLPGGRAVNYLAHQTEAFGDKMSSRITELGHDVTNLGREIQRSTDDQSQRVEDIGREVDSDESVPYPAKGPIEESDAEEADNPEDEEPLEPSFLVPEM